MGMLEKVGVIRIAVVRRVRVIYQKIRIDPYLFYPPPWRAFFVPVSRRN